jgi:hypothetical protein
MVQTDTEDGGGVVVGIRVRALFRPLCFPVASVVNAGLQVLLFGDEEHGTGDSERATTVREWSCFS